jgi:Adenylate and Guanylate cyclase catalytic domain
VTRLVVAHLMDLIIVKFSQTLLVSPLGVVFASQRRSFSFWKRKFCFQIFFVVLPSPKPITNACLFSRHHRIYHSFDEIARRRRVFKVETVGDCYVAVVGLPDPRKDHAVIMARFARDCMQTVNDLTKKLEVTLGPDTGDLQIRIGLHSGPVTAGVVS